MFPQPFQLHSSMYRSRALAQSYTLTFCFNKLSRHMRCHGFASTFMTATKIHPPILTRMRDGDIMFIYGRRDEKNIMLSLPELDTKIGMW